MRWGVSGLIYVMTSESGVITHANSARSRAELVQIYSSGKGSAFASFIQLGKV